MLKGKNHFKCDICCKLLLPLIHSPNCTNLHHNLGPPLATPTRSFFFENYLRCPPYIVPLSEINKGFI